MKRIAWSTSLAASLSFFTGCAGGGNMASELAKPPELPNKEPKCGNTKIQARPLIVDWPSSDRAALEARMKQGLVPVRYVGCDMEVVTTCKIPAAYGYTGITPKNDKVVIRNNDELYANIPVHAAKFEAKLQRSGSLEVEMTIIGRYDAGRASVRANELQGECGEATHVITALTVGAFKFSAGAGADVGAGLKVGDIGAGGKSTASNETLNTDGDGKKCENAKGDDKAPPFGCGALLRVELLPLGEARKDTPVCPAGTKWEGEQCVASAAPPNNPPPPNHPPAKAGDNAKPKAGVCNDASSCEEACNAGDSRACVTVGEMFYNARGVAKDGARAAVFFKTACDRGEPTGCVDLGWAHQSGTGVDKNGATAAAFFGKACSGSSVLGCIGLGTLYKSGASGVTKDLRRAAAYFKQACDGGNATGCKMLKDLSP